MDLENQIELYEPGPLARKRRRPQALAALDVEPVETLNLLSYWIVLRKRRWTVLAVFVFVFAAVLLGTLKETGAQDVYVQAGPGSSPYARLQSARTWFDPTSQRSLYRPDRLNWAPRLGISYAVGHTLLRTGYGVYYDRLSDTLTESARLNNVTFVPTGLLPKFQLQPPLQILAPYLPPQRLGVHPHKR